jgi:hypothetical protein
MKVNPIETIFPSRRPDSHPIETHRGLVLAVKLDVDHGTIIAEFKPGDRQALFAAQTIERLKSNASRHGRRRGRRFTPALPLRGRGGLRGPLFESTLHSTIGSNSAWTYSTLSAHRSRNSARSSSTRCTSECRAGDVTLGRAVTARTHFARQLLKRGNAVRRQGVAREWIVAARSN